MKIWHKIFTIFILAGLSAAIAHADKLPQFGAHSRDQFQDYWYNHGAEVSRFSLQQMRYGEIHEGDAVQVFVTEKMNPETQIKANHSGEQDITQTKTAGGLRRLASALGKWGQLTSAMGNNVISTISTPGDCGWFIKRYA